jgi:hypothetical protein
MPSRSCVPSSSQYQVIAAAAQGLFEFALPVIAPTDAALVPPYIDAADRSPVATERGASRSRLAQLRKTLWF